MLPFFIFLFNKMIILQKCIFYLIFLCYHSLIAAFGFSSTCYNVIVLLRDFICVGRFREAKWIRSIEDIRLWLSLC